MKYAVAAVVASLGTVAGGGAAAQQGAAQDEDAAASIVVTASRATDKPREIGSAVTVVTKAELERNQITFVKDALQDVPGVLVSSDRPGDIASVTIRGSTTDEVLWLVDGIELGDPSAISTRFQADHLTTADISRIEVLRGNQSSLYGSDAIGGVINIITARATEDGVGTSVEAEAGANGTLSGGASLLGRSGPLDVRLTTTGYRHGGPTLADARTSTSPVTEEDEYRRYGVSGRAGLAATERLSLQVIGFWRESFSDLDETTGDTRDTARVEEYALAAQGEYRAPGNALTARLTGSRYVARRLYFGTWNRPEGDFYKGIKDELSLDLAYDDGGIASLAAGANYEEERTDQLTSFADAFDAGINTRSAYGEIALRPVEGLTVTGAARIDDNSRFGTFDTYRGTIAYVIGPAKLRASYGTGAKAPGLYQLFDPAYGNPDLKAEESRGWDIGADIALGSGLSGQASYFVLRKTNEIVWDASRPPFGGYAQWGRTRANGVEIGLAARPVEFLRLSQTFTYIEHEADDALDGTYADSGRPKYTATSSVSVLPVEGAELTARVRYRDGDTSGFGGATEEYVVADLLGSYRINPMVEVYGRVTNLFDEFYQVTYGTNTLGRSFYLGLRIGF
jgi:vitamin B12 transporter